MKSWRDRILVLAFLAGIVLPGVGLFAWPQTALVPRAAQAPLPHRVLSRSFPKDFESYFESHLGFRDLLVKSYNSLSYLVLQTSPAPSVLVGNDGWLFYTLEQTSESFTGEIPFSEHSLNTWAANLTDYQNLVAQWGGKLLVVVAPNKSTIYPEQVPATLRARQRKWRNIDQFYERLRAENIPFVDLRPVLVAAKDRHQLYYPKDTHWNGHAAALASAAILEGVASLTGKNVTIADDDIVVTEEPNSFTGDLAGMMNLAVGGQQDLVATSVKNDLTTLVTPFPYVVSVLGVAGDQGALLFENKDERRDLARALVFRDSFGQALVPLLRTAFRRSVFLWTGRTHKDLAIIERPDVVIYQVVERVLMAPPPGPT